MTNVMTIAWEVAYEAVETFGGKVKEYFAESLKLAWIKVKTPKQVVVAIAEWFVSKNFSNDEAYIINNEAEFAIVSETEKAFMLKVSSDYGTMTKWFPKSVCLDKAVEVKKGPTDLERFENGFAKNQRLLAEAKELGVKGLRPRNRTETLAKKINARKIELGIA